MPRDPADGLHLRVEGAVATVTIDNAAEENRLMARALAALPEIARSLGSRDDVHIVVFRGAGHEFFSTGLLNPEIRARLSKEEVVALVMQAVAAFDAVEALPQLTLAALNGTARAGGVELALACDIRVAAAHARLCLPEARWGGFPGAGGPARLARIVGRARALELIATGREIDHPEMVAIGLVLALPPAADFDAALAQFVAAMGASGPLALRGAKKIMKVGEQSGFAAACEVSNLLRRQLEWSEDVDEGLRAHREGRAPRFSGR